MATYPAYAFVGATIDSSMRLLHQAASAQAAKSSGASAGRLPLSRR
ncbi:hypothetical protein [Streptomyces sp. NPDC005017]